MNSGVFWQPATIITLCAIHFIICCEIQHDISLWGGGGGGGGESPGSPPPPSHMKHGSIENCTGESGRLN